MQEGKPIGIVSISYSDVVHISLQLFLWNMMFEWQTLLESGDLPTPACSDLYYASEERAVSLRGSLVSLVCIYLTSCSLSMYVHVHWHTV